MSNKNLVQNFIEEQKQACLTEGKELPEIRPGDTVKIWEKVRVGEGEQRIRTFEGQVLAKKHGNQIGATITVRREIKRVGVERIFPLYSSIIQKIKVLRKGKSRRAKLYYLREAKGKRARIKERR